MGYVLTLDAAGEGFSAGVVGDCVLAERRQAGARGSAGALPAMAAEVLHEAGVAAAGLAKVVVTVGPGGFTGLRAALSLAHGIGLAAGIPVVGVTVGEALWQPTPGRALWVAVDSRRGRVFLERDGLVWSPALDAVPDPAGPLALAGDAAPAVAARLIARGHDVLLLDSRHPTPLGIMQAARRGANRPAQPLYVDPPEARPS